MKRLLLIVLPLLLIVGCSKVEGQQQLIPNITERYKRNKWLAVKYCDYMIQEEKDEFKKLFEESKKKDDLSDSYLQGIYYICK